MRSASRTKPRSAPMLGERPFENEPGKILSGETERRSRVLLDGNLCSCILRAGQNQHIAIQQIKVRPESLFLFRILDRDRAPGLFPNQGCKFDQSQNCPLRALFPSPVAVWRDRLHPDSIDFFTYCLAVDDSRLGMEISFERLNDQRIVCPPKTPGDDPPTSAAYVLR